MTKVTSRGVRGAGRRRGGRRDHSEHRVLAGDPLLEQADRGSLPGNGRPGQLEIAVGGGRAIAERDDALPLPLLLDADRVGRGFDAAQREGGLETDRQRQRIDRRVPQGVEHRRFDLGAIRHGVGADHEAAVGGEVDDGRGGLVARRGDERQAQRRDLARLPDALLVFDLDEHGLAGADIGDRVGEEVGALLLG